MKNNFAKNLCELRRLQQWRQVDLAVRLNTTQRKVSYWEQGKIEPDMDTLLKLSELFGVSIDELLKD